jgi:hypothetical protein
VFSGLNFSSVVHAQAPVEIRLVFGPNVAAAHQEAFRRFVPQVQPFFAKVLGRPKMVSATIYVYATLEERKQAWMQAKGVSAERADVSLGMSIAVAPGQEIWYRLDDPGFSGPAGWWFAKILVHEIFHTWLFEFSPRANTLVPVWIFEGSAEFIGYLGAVEMKIIDRDTAYRELTNTAQQIVGFTSLSQLPHLSDWATVRGPGAVLYRIGASLSLD